MAQPIYFTAPTKPDNQIRLYEVVSERTVQNFGGPGGFIRYVVLRDAVTEFEQTVTGNRMLIFQPVMPDDSDTEDWITWFAVEENRASWLETLADIRGC